jgi:hypothetical protein
MVIVLKYYLDIFFYKEYIFNDYITDLYEIKKSNKDDHMYLISKLLTSRLRMSSERRQVVGRL